MTAALPYQFLADVVLVLHSGIVMFVVFGLVLVIVGNTLVHWTWVNSWWFRLAHILTIGVVVAQSWLGMVCPLTTLESWLRVQAGSPSYRKSFIEHWVQHFLFYEAPSWVFTLAYTVFASLVLVSWWCFPPGYRKQT